MEIMYYMYENQIKGEFYYAKYVKNKYYNK